MTACQILSWESPPTLSLATRRTLLPLLHTTSQVHRCMCHFLILYFEELYHLFSARFWRCQDAEAFELSSSGFTNGVFVKFLKKRLLDDEKITVVLDRVAEGGNRKKEIWSLTSFIHSNPKLFHLSSRSILIKVLVVSQTWVISMPRRESKPWRSAAVFQRGGLWPTQFCPATARISQASRAVGGQRPTVSSEDQLSVWKWRSSALAVMEGFSLGWGQSVSHTLRLVGTKSGSLALTLTCSVTHQGSKSPLTYISGLLDSNLE